MAELTVERLFGNPPLTGTLPTQLKFAPDGSYVTYLQAASDDRQRLELWRKDLPDGAPYRWLDAADLIDGSAASGSIISAAEKAERERKRLFNTGITSFEISPSGQWLLIPLEGTGHLFDTDSGSLSTFTPGNARQTDFRFSPGGSFISYVRANDLYYYDLANGEESRVTTDGSSLIANGIADFIAQEEMHRFEGHWWSKDEAQLAFTRTDESTVAVSQRYEIDADEFNVIEQRYPYPGQANADVELHVLDLASGEQRALNWRHVADDYLARVQWSGNRLAVQVQSRDQQTLTLDLHQPGKDGRRTVFQEASSTWINLNDNFSALDPDRFLITSERQGSSQIYLYRNGEVTALTSGPGRVEQILYADQDRIIFSGWQEAPTEQHLYTVPLSGGAPRALTDQPGWHDFVVDAGGTRFIDRWSNLTDMGEIRIVDVTGDRQMTLEPAADSAAHPYAEFADQHVTPVIGTLTAEDGQTLFYRLTQPSSGTTKHPLIIYVYGGPGVQRVKNEWAPLLLQLFAGAGFGVLELDNRGSSNRSREFEAPIYGRLGDAEVRDQLTGAHFAQALDWVDESRIGVFGHSYGGFMTLMCLAQAPEVFKAGVAVAPVSDWSLYDTHYTERFLSTPAANPDGYARSAVFPHLDSLQGRLLIMHGMADDNVLFTHSTKLFKALQAQGTPFEMMTYPGSKHALQEQDVSIHRFNLILDFFKRSL